MNTPLSRRRFLHTLTVIGTAALLPSAAAPAQADDGAFVPVGKPDDFKDGDYKPITLPDGTLLFVGRQKANLLALSSACTHKGCTVSWSLSDEQFQCPCHKGRFDNTGKNIGGPPPKPLPTHAVKVENGQVMVQP